MQETDLMAPPHGLMGLERAAEPWENPWLWVAGAFIILFLGILAYHYRRRRAQPVGPEAPNPWQHLDSKVKSLGELVNSDPIAVQEYYSQLSQILREGLEQRFGFGATSQTLAELSASLDRLPHVTAEQRREWLAFFEQADRIKFAAANARLADHQTWRQRVGSWLKQLSEAS